MTKLLRYVIVVLFALLVFQACGSTQTAADKEMRAAEIKNAVEIPHFTFEATYAYPNRFMSVYLSPYYDVKVTPDTVKAYLPYYGRAYRTPMDPREGGFNFTSTDFSYQVAQGKKKGNWIAQISILDLDRAVTLSFDIWENGTARLDVSDVNREHISFLGNIETANKR